MVPYPLADSDADRALLLLHAAAAGDAGAWGALLTVHGERLGRMVAFRLDPRLRGRVDPADVLQEAYLAAAGCRADYFRLPPPPVPVFVWLRGVVANKLLEVHRHHLGAAIRDAGREAAAAVRDPGASPADATSAALVDHLSGSATGPRTAAGRSEIKQRLRAALDAM